MANVAGADLALSETTQDEIFENTKNAAYAIINAKGSTYYAIALALDRIVTAILQNESSVLNVSTLLDNYHGISDVYLGLPCVVDSTGVREHLEIPMNDKELELLNASANKLKSEIAKVNL